jgi:hypothetical protein
MSSGHRKMGSVVVTCLMLVCSLGMVWCPGRAGWKRARAVVGRVLQAWLLHRGRRLYSGG